MEMESTSEFVERLRENKRKDDANRKRQGNGNPSKRLPQKNKK